MFRSAIVLICIALAVQAKTRKGPLPHLFWDKVKHLDAVDEPEDRIVGGTEIDISERPFQIVFLYYGSLRCGGAWIGGKNILTAAHCCDGVSASSVSVRLGSSNHASGGEVIDVAQVIPHPNYDDFDISNDACILILENTPTNGSSEAAPVALPNNPNFPIPDGATFVVSGWGTTSEGGSLPSTLRQVEVPYINDEDCTNAYGSGNIIGDVMICAGEAGKDSCQGDSGGPLTYLGIHVGIVSWGYGCARPEYPGVYAQTDAFLDFINSNAQGNGEEVCEGYEFSQAECLAIACCDWDEKCWSFVGQDQCWGSMLGIVVST